MVYCILRFRVYSLCNMQYAFNSLVHCLCFLSPLMFDTIAYGFCVLAALNKRMGKYMIASRPRQFEYIEYNYFGVSQLQISLYLYYLTSTTAVQVQYAGSHCDWLCALINASIYTI